MAASAAARAVAPLTYYEAMRIINAMPFLVCTCTHKLLNSQFRPDARGRMRQSRNPLPEIYPVAFEVWNGPRSYIFPEQPFRVVRVITKAEFKRAAPWACTGRGFSYYYHIATD